MSIPKKVKVGGIEYKVIFPYHFTEDTCYQGLHDENLCEIKVDGMHMGKVRPYERVSETFLHELIHAVDSVYNNAGLEHDYVDIFTSSLYNIIKENDLRKVPDKLYIMGMVYKIRYPFEFVDIEQSITVNHDQLEICIDGGACEQKALIAVWFAIFNCISIAFIKEEDFLDSDLLIRFAYGFSQVYKDNELWKVIK